VRLSQSLCVSLAGSLNYLDSSVASWFNGHVFRCICSAPAICVDRFVLFCYVFFVAEAPSEHAHCHRVWIHAHGKVNVMF